MGWEPGARQQDFTQLSLSGLVASPASSLGGRHRQAAASGGPARRPRPARWASAGGVRGRSAREECEAVVRAAALKARNQAAVASGK